MNNPKHTANWLLDRIYDLTNSDPSQDLATVGAILVILDQLEDCIRGGYVASSYLAEKINGARSMLMVLIGAEPDIGHSRSALLHFAAKDLTTLSAQEFRVLE
jgi:hypothetical protein